MRERFDRRRADMLDEQNAQNYRHGRRWALEASDAGVSKMHSMSAEVTIHNIDIINHDITVIERYIETMVQQMHASLMTHLFQTAGEAAESAGNVIICFS
jgi:hypothetical protein